MSNLTPFEKANRALINYPRFDQLKHMIEIAHRQSREANEPQCIALEGPTGAGKTTLIQDYVRTFPRLETPTGSEIPVFYMETPSPVTVKGMAISLLSRLGDPAANRGTLPVLNNRLIQFLIQCKVQLVILDDFHHLIDRDKDRVLSTVSDWLKVIIKESHVPFMVVGIEGKVERILQANDQLSRLFAFREALEPFAWDMQNTDSLREFAKFVKTAERSIGTEIKTALPRAELLHRFHYATDGVVANMMNLMRYAAFLASERKETVIDMACLREAFNTRLAKHLRHKVNPFETHWGDIFTTPEDTLFDPPEGVSNRLKQHSTRLRTASEVLKT